MLWHLDVLTRAIIVLIGLSFSQPASIMCVRYNMHVESVFAPASRKEV